MSPEKAKSPSPREILSGYLDKPRSTGHLMRLAKQVLRNNPAYIRENPGVNAALYLPWINIKYNGNSYLIRMDRFTIEENGERKFVESLFITKYLPNNQVESLSISTDGQNTEQKWGGKTWTDEEVGGPLFHGVSYLVGKDKASEEFKDEDFGETSWLGEFGKPITGKDALPHAQRILKELLGVKEPPRSKQAEMFKKRETLLEQFIETLNQPKSRETDEMTDAGYDQFLKDVMLPQGQLGGLVLSFKLDSKELEKLFLDYVKTQKSSLSGLTQNKLTLIYFYGLWDGARKNRREIAEILGYKNRQSIDPSIARGWFLSWLETQKRGRARSNRKQNKKNK